MPAMGRADLHLHTCFSDGWPTPTDVVEYVVERGELDVIAITDHDVIEGALRAREYSLSRGGPEVIIGEEVSSRDGHVVGLFLQKRIRPGMSAAATVDAIHAQGGLAFAAHPFWRRQDGGSRKRVVHGVGWLTGELAFDAIEVENSSPGLGIANLVAQRVNVSLELPELGNSDAHILQAIGRSYTQFPGRTAPALRRAIEKGRTSAGKRRYGPVALARYVAWGLNHQRVLLPAS